MPEADDAVIAEIDRLLTADPLGLPTCFGERRGERWWRVDGLAETPAVVRWIDEIVTRRDGDRSPADAAAVVTIGRLAHAVVARPAIVFAVQGRALLAGRSLVVQRDPDGPFEAVALRPEPVLVQPSDPLAGTPGTVVADTSTMIAALAAEWSAALGPLVELGRARGRVGRRGLWGRIADTVGASVLWAAQSLGWDEPRQLDAWRAAMHLCDDLAARQSTRPLRPRLIRDNGAIVSVPCACCLLYKADRSRRPDGTRERCAICPLEPDVAAAPSLPLAG